MPTFIDKLKSKWNEGRFVCVGLDPDYTELPNAVKKSDNKEESILLFNLSIIDVTANLVCAYKLNTAFYEAEGTLGWSALEKTVEYIKKTQPSIPVILDAKRADISSTSAAYAKMAFDNLGADAVTIHPYLGKDAILPFLEYENKGIIVLVKTSNKGAGEFQDLKVSGKPLYELVAGNVAGSWNKNKNCAVVVGATHPEELKSVRKIIGDMPILIPGIGSQKGDLKSSIENGVNSENQGIIISSSRSIIFASKGADFADAAKQETEKLHNQIKEIIDG